MAFYNRNFSTVSGLNYRRFNKVTGQSLALPKNVVDFRCVASFCVFLSCHLLLPDSWQVRVCWVASVCALTRTWYRLRLSNSTDIQALLTLSQHTSLMWLSSRLYTVQRLHQTVSSPHSNVNTLLNKWILVISFWATGFFRTFKFYHFSACLWNIHDVSYFSKAQTHAHSLTQFWASRKWQHVGFFCRITLYVRDYPNNQYSNIVFTFNSYCAFSSFCFIINWCETPRNDWMSDNEQANN